MLAVGALVAGLRNWCSWLAANGKVALVTTSTVQRQHMSHAFTTLNPSTYLSLYTFFMSYRVLQSMPTSPCIPPRSHGVTETSCLHTYSYAT